MASRTLTGRVNTAAVPDEVIMADPQSDDENADYFDFLGA
jgi:hypothetical protein